MTESNMLRRCRCAVMAVLAAVLLAVSGGGAQAQGLKLTFVTTNKDVDEATKRLTAFLWVRQLDDGSWTDVTGAHYQRRVGWTTALASLALLESGVKLSRPEMDKALQSLMAAEMTDSISHATRAMALCVAYRAARRKEWEVQIVKDLEWLTQNLPEHGAWGYKGADRHGNNMASQFGLLALWEAELAGFDGNRKFERSSSDNKSRKNTKDTQEAFDPARAWPNVLRNLKRAWPQIEQQWISRQRADHGWTFSALAGEDVQSTMVMTAAGASSLYIVLDKVYAPKMFPGKPPPKTKVFEGIDAGMGWLAPRLEPGFTKDGYLSFGIQRIAAAGGHKYIGQHDWFRLGVSELMEITTNCGMNVTGPYGPDIEAAMYLLFLSRGRAPVTFNKLQRPGTDWDCAPRDIANLTRFLNKELEQRMNWQIVDVDRPVAEFLDAPVLLVNGIKPLALKEEIIQKIREYVNRGGFVLGEATTASHAFAESFREMMVKAFPEGTREGAKYYRWQEVPPGHPLLETMTDRDLQRLGTIWAMDSPIRTVAVLLPRDQATAWQQMDVVKNRHSFTIGRNILLYATAGEQLKTRLRPVYAGRTITAKTVRKVAALSTTGQWLGEPYVIERLSDKLARDAMIMVEAAPSHAPGELDPRETPMIWVYGHGAITLTEGRIESLRRYVQKGGLVALSANKGDKVFARAAAEVALKILPGALPEALEPTDPVMTGLVYRERGNPLTDPQFRGMRLAGERKVKLTAYRTDKRIGVMVSPYDVFLGVLGTPIYGNKDYAGETAQQIAANIYLYALEQAERVAEEAKK